MMRAAGKGKPEAVEANDTEQESQDEPVTMEANEEDSDQDLEMAEPSEPLATTRSRRTNAGSRMNTLILEEEEDEFYTKHYGGFQEEEDDNDFDEDEEVEDDSDTDSDFDIDETDEIAPEHQAVDEEGPRKRKAAYTEPKRRVQHGLTTSTPVQQRGPPNTPGSSSTLHRPERSFRDSTKKKTAETIKNVESGRKKRKVRTIEPHRKLTQEELLEEAKITEEENIKSLEIYQRLESEKLKKIKLIKKSIPAPYTTYYSSVFINPETKEKYSRNFCTINTSEQESESECSPKDEVKVDKDEKPVIDEKGNIKVEKVVDATGCDLIAFRRTVYLIIRSSIRHEEVVHKLMKLKIPAELHDELCQMILDCCGQERTYESLYGLVASNLCQINGRNYAPKFENLMGQFYEAVHRFKTNKIRNVAKFFAHLLVTDSIDWSCISCMKLRENATTSAGCCFIKFLFQELVAMLSMRKFKELIKQPARAEAFKDIFPKSPEQDTRFAINFFTFSNLGELAEDLRQELLALQ